MTKYELLQYLRTTAGVRATQVASAFGVDYPAAAMALLRLTRQGLASRALDPVAGILWYRLTDRGAERLAYLRSEG
jgi:predicted ArsR family transcriptional regulator